MISLLKKKIASAPTLDYSSFMVIYQTDDATWRGFVVPFDITYESESKETVQTVLNDMIHSYVEALRQYDNPGHLAKVPLSDEQDNKKWSRISLEVLNQLKNNIPKIQGSDYYVEAQSPA